MNLQLDLHPDFYLLLQRPRSDDAFQASILWKKGLYCSWGSAKTAEEAVRIAWADINRAFEEDHIPEAPPNILLINQWVENYFKAYEKNRGWS